MNLAFSVVAAAFCIAMGAYHSRRLQMRLCAIEALIAALTQMDMNMQYASLPLEAVLRKTQGALEPLFAAMAECVGKGMSAGEAFDASIEQVKDNGYVAALQVKERLALEEFALCLGRSDRETQRANTLLAIERLRPLLNEASMAAQAKGRMYRSLGLLCGAAVAILLM